MVVSDVEYKRSADLCEVSAMMDTATWSCGWCIHKYYFVCVCVCVCVLALAAGFKYGFKKGREAQEAEMTQQFALLMQHSNEQHNVLNTVRTLSQRGCRVVW